MNSFFLLNMNFLFEQKFMFKISFFFYRNLFILTILKGLKPFYLQGKTWNWIKKLFSLWFFNGYCMIHDNVGGIRDPLKQDIVLEICREKKQRHYYFNWNSLFGLHLFFSSGNSYTKGLLILLHLSLEGITEVNTDPKGGFVSFKVTPLLLMTGFSVLMPLQGIAPWNRWLGGVSLKDYKLYEK